MIKIENALDLFSTPEIHKILLLRQDRLGDVIISLPLFEVLKDNFPDKEFQICLGEKNISAKPFIQSFFDKVWFYQKDVIKILHLIKKLNSEKFDLIIDLLDNSSRTSTILLKFIRSKYKLGFDKENREVYTHTVPIPDKSKVHIVERLFNLLLPLNISTSYINKKINIQLDKDIINLLPRNSDKRRLGINLVGSSQSKYWGENNYKDFINEFLINHIDFEVVIFVQKEMSDLQLKICKETSAIPAPTTEDLQQLAKMISTCDYFITPDTATVHFASAFNIPTLVFYYVPEIPPKLLPWTPYKTPYKAILTTESIQSIKVSDALIKIDELINQK